METWVIVLIGILVLASVSVLLYLLVSVKESFPPNPPPIFVPIYNAELVGAQMGAAENGTITPVNYAIERLPIKIVVIEDGEQIYSVVLGPGNNPLQNSVVTIPFKFASDSDIEFLERGGIFVTASTIAITNVPGFGLPVNVSNATISIAGVDSNNMVTVELSFTPVPTGTNINRGNLRKRLLSSNAAAAQTVICTINIYINLGEYGNSIINGVHPTELEYQAWIDNFNSLVALNQDPAAPGTTMTITSSLEYASYSSQA